MYVFISHSLLLILYLILWKLLFPKEKRTNINKKQNFHFLQNTAGKVNQCAIFNVENANNNNIINNKNIYLLMKITHYLLIILYIYQY